MLWYLKEFGNRIYYRGGTMKSFSSFVVNHKKLIVIIGLLLIIPALIGFALTKTNYDILVYLPDDIETLKGQNILKDDFNR